MPDSAPSLPLRRRMLVPMIAAATVVVCCGTAALFAAEQPERTAVASRDGHVSRTVDRGDAGRLQDPIAPDAMTARTEATATRIRIPRIGVDSALEQLPLDPVTGELTAPVDWMSAGWYRDGTVPGDTGPAVVAGHVDSVVAPAVFARLGELVRGDRIMVALSNGESVQFAVDSQRTAAKDAFPTAEVYGPTPVPELRLITCDGAFDAGSGHYVDNLIVDARLV